VLLHLVTDDDRRGAQVFGVELDRALGARGRPGRTVALAEGRTGGLGVPHLGPGPLAPDTLRALRAELRRSTAAVAHGSATLPATAVAGIGTRIPVVYRNIGDPLYWSSTPSRRTRVRLYLRRMAGVVALWPGSAQVLVERLGVPGERVTVIPNGVPADRFPPPDPIRRKAAREDLGLDPDGPVVVAVGALSAEKSLDTAIAALDGVPGLTLLVVGDGAHRGRLQALAAGRPVRFLGALPSPVPAFAAADAIVLPSLSEGMPGVLIEAGLSGLPAVATAVGGVAEIVLPGRTGQLVPPRDPAAMADALRTVLASAPELGRAARAHCLARFELGVVADAWDRFLAGY
jgi:glycosyltransferase involved in cell wall biosynthesis